MIARLIYAAIAGIKDISTNIALDILAIQKLYKFCQLFIFKSRRDELADAEVMVILSNMDVHSLKKFACMLYKNQRSKLAEWQM